VQKILTHIKAASFAGAAMASFNRATTAFYSRETTAIFYWGFLGISTKTRDFSNKKGPK
jgi:hypothetical protein